ncbi:uncharacterized protein LOC116596559 isoform X1 [Mustela erminea]|uniref:uncharacterized protein LOC116596559 isoform X1 n=1 Tax=Mustela erminea TaxID=36723 RepID=UPI0013868E0E|nr:uncharacterized protein LOC116596559 isoform X1 [Mustela erminea]
MYDFCIGKSESEPVHVTPISANNNTDSICHIRDPPWKLSLQGSRGHPLWASAQLGMLGILRGADRHRLYERSPSPGERAPRQAAAQKICLLPAYHPTEFRLKTEHQVLPGFPDCQPTVQVWDLPSTTTILQIPKKNGSLSLLQPYTTSYGPGSSPYPNAIPRYLQVSSFKSLLSIPVTLQCRASLKHTPASPISLPQCALPLST